MIVILSLNPRRMVYCRSVEYSVMLRNRMDAATYQRVITQWHGMTRERIEDDYPTDDYINHERVAKGLTGQSDERDDDKVFVHQRLEDYRKPEDPEHYL